MLEALANGYYFLKTLSDTGIVFEVDGSINMDTFVYSLLH